MKSLRGLTLTRRGETAIVSLVLVLCALALFAIVVHVDREACEQARSTGTEWRIDRACSD